MSAEPSCADCKGTGICQRCETGGWCYICGGSGECDCVWVQRFGTPTGARDWPSVRAEAIDSGRIDPQQTEAHREAPETAHTLPEVSS